MLKAKAVLTATIGNAIVYYDMTLYGFFAAYLSPMFFPAEDLLTSQLASLSVFAAGFFARPFGGLVFGHIGDRYGRKKALVIAILLITIPTAIIGLLPSYHTIGILAPIILVICKLLQGVCTGGEYSGAAIFLSEHHRGHNEGLAGSILPASSIVGAILGTSLGGLCTLSSMPIWAWRIPFLLGGILGILGYFLRSALMESPEFMKTQKEDHLAKLPILEVIKQDKRAFLWAVCISTHSMIMFYVPVVYIAQFMLPKEAQVSVSMFLNTGLMVLLIILLPLMGSAADRYGKGKIMELSSIATLLLSLPIFLFLNNYTTVWSVLIILTLFGILMSAYVAPSVSFIPKLFPIQERYSAMAMAIGLGEALGGTTPLVCHTLSATMGTHLAPAFYLIGCSIIGWFAVRNSEFKIRDMLQEPLPNMRVLNLMPMNFNLAKLRTKK